MTKRRRKRDPEYPWQWRGYVPELGRKLAIAEMWCREHKRAVYGGVCLACCEEKFKAANGGVYSVGYDGPDEPDIQPMDDLRRLDDA